MEDIVAADGGEVVLLRINYQRALQLEGDAAWAVCYCILKRAGGFLLALPPTYIPQPVLDEASREGFTGILGPFELTTAPAVELSETGEWVGVYPARDISVLIADFKEQAVAGVEVLEEGLGDCVPFVEESGNLFPLASHLVVFSSTWATGIEGDRGAGYYTAEEHAPSGAALGRRPKVAGEAKRRPTVAVLAAQQSEIVQALQALSSQVQTLAKAGQAREPPQRQGTEPPRPALAAPISAAIVPSPAGPRAVADVLGAPPRGRVMDIPAPSPELDGLPLDCVGRGSRARRVANHRLRGIGSEQGFDSLGGSAVWVRPPHRPRVWLSKLLVDERVHWAPQASTGACFALRDFLREGLRGRGAAHGADYRATVFGRRSAATCSDDPLSGTLWRVQGPPGLGPGTVAAGPDFRSPHDRPGRRSKGRRRPFDGDGGSAGARRWVSRTWLHTHFATGSARSPFQCTFEHARVQPPSMLPPSRPQVGRDFPGFCERDGDLAEPKSRSGEATSSRSTGPRGSKVSSSDSKAAEGKAMGGAKNRCDDNPAQGLKASADGSSSGPQVRSSRACQPSARLAPGPGAFGCELPAVARPSFQVVNPARLEGAMPPRPGLPQVRRRDLVPAILPPTSHHECLVRRLSIRQVFAPSLTFGHGPLQCHGSCCPPGLGRSPLRPSWSPIAFP